jgi:integrase
MEAKRIADEGKNRLTADEVYAAILGTVAAPEPQIPTVAEWADIYLESKTRISPGTKGRYRSQLDQEILPRIGGMRLDKVGGIHISRIINELRAKGFSDATATRYYAVIHALFGYALVEKKIPDNPAKRTDFIRDLVAHDDTDDIGADHVYLTREEYALIRSHAAPDAQLVMDFLIGTGCRWGEATAVHVDAVNPMAKPAPAVRIHRAWKRDERGRWYEGTTKGRSRRLVQIGSVLLDALLPIIAAEPGDTLLLRAPRGGRLVHSNFVNRRWDPAVAAAMRCPAHPPVLTEMDPATGAPKLDPSLLAVSTCECPTRIRKRPTIHDLRHSHTAWLIAAGQPLAAISKRLGHHSVTITEQVYGGILPEVNDAMALALDAAMGSASTPMNAVAV